MTVEGKPVPVKGRRADLVGVFATMGKNLMSRDALVDVLFDGEPSDSADSALRGHLGRLDGLCVPYPFLIKQAHTPTLYGLNPSTVRVDAVNFVAEIERANTIRRSDPMAAETLYDSALRQWGGEPFCGLRPLAPFVYEARRLHLIHNLAEEELAQLRLDRLPPEDLLVELNEAALRVPGSERRWIQLMTALYLTGNVGEALATHDRAEKMMVGATGVDPTSDFKAFQIQMLSHQIRRTATSPSMVFPEILKALGSVVVGREQEVNWCVNRQGLSILLGKPGIGKTTIVAETAKRFVDRHPGARVRYTSCYRHDSEALGPFRRLIGDAAAATPAIAADQLARIGQGLDSLFVVDDVHLADDATIEALEALSHQLLPRGMHVLVCGHPTGSPVERLRRCAGIETVTVGPLTTADIESLLEPHRFSVADLALVSEIAQGWPLLAHLASACLTQQSAANEILSTDVLRAETGSSETDLTRLMDRLLVGFSSTAERVIKIAAVCGERFRLADIVTILGVTSIEVDRALQDAVTVGLVVVDHDPRFGHELLRDAVLASIAPPLRRQLEHQASEIADLEPWERYVHLLRAAPLVNLSDTLTASAAARKAAKEKRQWNGVLTLGSLECELTHPTEETPVPDRIDERIDCLVDIAEAQENRGHFVAAIKTRDHALELSEHYLRFDLAVKAIGLSPLNGRSIGSSPSWDHLERARRLAPTSGTHRWSDLAIGVRSEQITLHALMGTSSPGIDSAVLESLGQTFRDGPAKAIQPPLLRAWIYLNLDTETSAVRHTHCTTLLEHALGTNDPALIGESRQLLLRSALERGSATGAAHQLFELNELSHVTARPVDRWASFVGHGCLSTMQGQHHSAARFCNEAAELGHQLGVNDTTTTWWIQRLVLRLLSGPDLAAGLPDRQDTTTIATYQSLLPMIPPARRAGALAVAAIDAAQDGNTERARPLLIEALKLFEPNEADFLRVPTAAFLIEACWLLRYPPPESVVDVLDQRHENVVVVGVTPVAVLGPAVRLVALADSLRGATSATRHFEQALDSCERAEMKGWFDRCHQDFSQHRVNQAEQCSPTAPGRTQTG